VHFYDSVYILCENMTSFTKPEVHNVLHNLLEEDRTTTRWMYRKFVEMWIVIFEICERTAKQRNRQTNRHTYIFADRNTSCAHGQVNKLCQWSYNSSFVWDNVVDWRVTAKRRCGALVMFEDERSYMHVHVVVEFEVSHHERSHVAGATSLDVAVAARRRPILPSFRYRRSWDINLSAGGLACRATPRRDETNWEIMPLNAAGRPDPITLVFSNTSPSTVHSLSFYFTYRPAVRLSADRRLSIIQTILTDYRRANERGRASSTVHVIGRFGEQAPLLTTKLTATKQN